VEMQGEEVVAHLLFIPTSQMAIDSCRHSLNTLQIIIDDRRTT